MSLWDDFEADTAFEHDYPYGIPCHPFYDENEQPCYLGDECKKPNCPMRKELIHDNN